MITKNAEGKVMTSFDVQLPFTKLPINEIIDMIVEITHNRGISVELLVFDVG